MKEKEIQKVISDYLSLKRIFFYRNNSGAFRSEGGGFYRFGATGSPDIVAVIKGNYIGIEVKTEKGRMSPGQKMFQENLEKAGGIYLLVRSLNELIDKLNRYC